MKFQISNLKFLFVFAALLLLTAHCSLPTVQGQGNTAQYIKKQVAAPVGQCRVAASGAQVVIAASTGDFYTCKSPSGLPSSTGTWTVVGGATAMTFGTQMYCHDAGSTDAYACNLVPTPNSVPVGTQLRFKANTANTGQASITFNGFLTLTIVKTSSAGVTTTLADGDIRAGKWVDCIVAAGSTCQMQNLLGNAPSATAAGSDTQVQFNDGGSGFGGDAGLTYNKTTNVLTTEQVVTSGTINTTRPYKVYTALWTQSGTSAPTATVFENTLGGSVVLFRDSAGVYRAVLAGAFPSSKVFVTLTPGSGGDAIDVVYEFDPPNQIFIYTKQFSVDFGAEEVESTTLDGLITDVPLSIEFRVYP